MRKFTVVLMRDPDSKTFVVYVPELPGCFTQGGTIEKALNRAREAIAGHVASVESHGEEIPEEPAEVVVASVEVNLRSAGIAAGER